MGQTTGYSVLFYDAEQCCAMRLYVEGNDELLICFRNLLFTVGQAFRAHASEVFV